jgi:hypothetical protein
MESSAKTSGNTCPATSSLLEIHQVRRIPMVCNRLSWRGVQQRQNSFNYTRCNAASAILVMCAAQPSSTLGYRSMLDGAVEAGVSCWQRLTLMARQTPSTRSHHSPRYQHRASPHSMSPLWCRLLMNLLSLYFFLSLLRSWSSLSRREEGFPRTHMLIELRLYS